MNGQSRQSAVSFPLDRVTYIVLYQVRKVLTCTVPYYAVEVGEVSVRTSFNASAPPSPLLTWAYLDCGPAGSPVVNSQWKGDVGEYNAA